MGVYPKRDVAAYNRLRIDIVHYYRLRECEFTDIAIGSFDKLEFMNKDFHVYMSGQEIKHISDFHVYMSGQEIKHISGNRNLGLYILISHNYVAASVNCPFKTEQNPYYIL